MLTSNDKKTEKIHMKKMRVKPREKTLRNGSLNTILICCDRRDGGGFFPSNIKGISFLLGNKLKEDALLGHQLLLLFTKLICVIIIRPQIKVCSFNFF